MPVTVTLEGVEGGVIVNNETIESITVASATTPGPRGPRGETGPPVADGDKGDITVSGDGSTWLLNDAVITLDHLSFDLATQPELDAHTGAANHPYLDAANTFTVDQVISRDNLNDGYLSLVGPNENLWFGQINDTQTISSSARFQILDDASRVMDTRGGITDASMVASRGLMALSPETNLPALIAKGLASQTANLFEAQDSTGELGTRITDEGKLTVGGFGSGGGELIMGKAGNSFSMETVSATTSYMIPNYRSFQFKTKTGSNLLFEAYSDNGSPQVGFFGATPASQPTIGPSREALQSLGLMAAGDFAATTDIAYQSKVNGDTDPRFTIEAGGTIRLSDGAGSDGPWFRWENASTLGIGSDYEDRYMTIQTSSQTVEFDRLGTIGGVPRFRFKDANTDYFEVGHAHNYSARATAFNENTVPIVAKGAASQAANLQEWQDSAGAVLASVDPDGRGTFAAGSVIQGATTSTEVMLQLKNSDSADVLKFSASGSTQASISTPRQTMEFESGSTSSGRFTFGLLNGRTIIRTIDDAIYLGAASGLTGTKSGEPTITIKDLRATDTNTLLAVEASEGQDDNLQEWRDSAGVVLASVDASGVGDFTGGLTWGGSATLDGSAPNNFIAVFRNNAANHFAVEDSGGTERLRIDTTGVGFFGETPVAQQAHPGTASGTDAAVINAMRDALINYGLLAAA